MSHVTGRCSECPKYLVLSSDKIVRRWHSYEVLDRTAEAGCDFCTLCRQYVAHRIGVDISRSRRVEITVQVFKHQLLLKVAGVGNQNYVNLPLLDQNWAPRGSVVDDSTELPANTYWYRNAPILGYHPTEHEGMNHFERCLDWINTCQHEHTDCQQEPEHDFAGVRQLPKRLIDLSHGDTVRIIDCELFIREGAINPETVRYCTLSYRWGRASHNCTLQLPFTGMMEFNIQAMPKTFRDAVTVARRLGIRFLWIDALCIVQPSTSDQTEWLEEGSRMGIIYQNALFTIAATAAVDASRGFLKRTGRRLEEAMPVDILGIESTGYPHEALHIPVSVPDFFACVSHSALNNRGWVIQERALSLRILHFSDHGIFWECGAIKAHNIFGTLEHREDFPTCRSRENMLRIVRTRLTDHLCPVEWFHFVRQYSFTEFTNPGDRLLAISAVAKALQPYFGGHAYIAGLWRDDLVRGLAWHCVPPLVRARDPGAPSWSWAAARGPVEFSVLAGEMFSYNMVKVVGTSIIPLIESNPHGKLHKGTVVLRGKLALEYLGKILPKQGSIGPSTPGLKSLMWDKPPSQQEQQSSRRRKELRIPQRYPVLPIAKTLPGRMCYLGALILEPTGKVPELVQTESGKRLRTEFRRIGWVEYAYNLDSQHDERRHWVEREEEEIALV